MTAVSVIIPTYNRSRMVVRAISSVLLQTYKDYEIVVVDDGSDDGTREAVAQFGDRILYRALPENLGVSAARNAGIRLSRSPFLAFLDSDDYWFSRKLSVQMAFFASHPQAAICQTEERWVRNGRRVNPRKKHLKPSGDIFEPSLRLCLVSPSSVALKRSLLDEVGWFDEALPACEDFDLWLRISCRHPVHLIREELLVKEGGHEDQLSSRYRGMDRFRIRALAKLLEGGRLTEVQRRAALRELSVKCRIYGNGCLRRGKTKEGERYLALPERLRELREARPRPPSATGAGRGRKGPDSR